MVRKLMKWSLAPLAATAVLLGGAAASNAATQAPITDQAYTIAPGTQGNIGASYQNLATTVANGNVTITLQAPTNATFNDNQLYGTSFQAPGAAPVQSVILTRDQCVLSNANKTLTCTGPITVPAAPAGGGSGWLDVQATVIVDPAAPYNTLYNDGSFTSTSNGDVTGGTTALQYQTPTDPAIPVVDPVVGLGAGILAAGTAATVMYSRRRRNASTAL